MSTPCEEIRPELEALLGQLTEGGLDVDARRRLARILHDHPEARQIYLDHCQMHALLRSAHGELSAVERPRRRWIPWAAAAAVLLAAAGAWSLRAPRLDATIDGRPLRVGERIAAAGEVRYRDGSRLTLQGRSDVAFHADGVELRDGLLRCEIKPQQRPFTIRTPHADATVIGTAFEIGAANGETRLRMSQGRVRLGSLEAKAGEVATADARGRTLWTPVCNLDFAALKALPAELESVFCISTLLHTPGRKVEAAARGRFLPGGFHLGAPGQPHGLAVWRWREAVGDDLLMEADVAGGERWSLGFSMSGDSFEGYRIIFAVMGYPEGISIDTIHPVDCVVLAQDPRPINYDRDHTLRVERRGRRMRVWIDQELRLDTEIAHPLPEGRRRTFAISNYGAPPLLRALRVWKADENP